MANILITGSSDGLGLLAGKALIAQGHEVALHARNEARAAETRKQAPGAAAVFIADFSDLKQVGAMASEANAWGRFDAVIHNAGVYRSAGTEQGKLPLLLTVNTLAPYLLTCLVQRPRRLVYMSSAMHLQGKAVFGDPAAHPPSYSDTKLHDLILAKAVARKWPDVDANAVNPGWVPTKMGGAGAPDSLQQGYETQAWLAAGEDPATRVSGHYFHHKKQIDGHPSADQTAVQDQLLDWCAMLTGMRFKV